MIRTSKSKTKFTAVAFATLKFYKSLCIGLSVVSAILLVFTIPACSQDSLFFDISNEPEPRSPLITGSPTNIILAMNELFVGSRMGNTIFRYGGTGGNPQWTTVPSPRGSIADLATDGENLYALVFPDGNPLASSVIQRFNIAANTWDAEFTSNLYSIQTIYGAGEKIFAGAMLSSDMQNFAILYLNPSTSSLSVEKQNTSLLTGAVMDEAGEIFLATAGSGIFKYSDDGGGIEATPESGTENANISGIISTGATIVAVGSNGALFSRDPAGIFSRLTAGINFTGAMSLWVDRASQWNPSLLLLGIRGSGSSNNHGYREIQLDSSGYPILVIRVPGEQSPTSVKNRARYSASIGLHPVEAILQLPDISRGGPIDYSSFSSNPEWEPPIFAGTSRSGLWSYWDATWNAEQ